MTNDVRYTPEIKTQNFLGKSSIQQERESFRQQIGLKLKEAPSALQHLEHSFVQCWNLGTLENSLEIFWKFWNLAP